MTHMKELPDEFLQSIQPYGKKYILQLYCITSINESKILQKEEDSIKDDISIYLLGDESWKFRVKLLEYSFSASKSVSEDSIFNLLVSCSKLYGPSWMILDGAFDITRLESNWSALNVYGFSENEFSAHIELNIEKRKESHWIERYQEFIRNVRRKVDAVSV